jgi:cell division control protein 7
MEVDCLRLAGGKANVLPLLFVHRYLGDVVLAMPYVEASKFSEVIKTMDLVEMKHYIKNLLIALAHIHSLGIIHRHFKHKDV